MIDTIATNRLPAVANTRGLAQLMRFSLVGLSNTTIDLAVFALLVWLFPTSEVGLLVLYNTLGYLLGAVNSFVWNKTWTFNRRERVSLHEVGRFTLTTVSLILVSNALLWELALLFSSFATGKGYLPLLLKGAAIGGTFLVSFGIMKIWVFARRLEKERGDEHFPGVPYRYSLSVVLPVYNEESNIRITLGEVLASLSRIVPDFEVIAVNDGSRDMSGTLLDTAASIFPRVRVIYHKENQGYGAALASGFAAATKELTLFMDSDGQFRARSLVRLLPFIEDYDAVFGYRLKREDTLLRKINAFGWKWLVWFAFGIQARDIDCAFKLFRTAWLHEHLPTTQGAMVNTELLYTFAQDGWRAKEVGVPHYPRTAGKASGASLGVILRALSELSACMGRWS